MGTEVLLYITIALALIGAATSAYMTYRAGQQQRQAAKANAEMLENQAQNQANVGKARAEAIRQRNRVMLASEEAKVGASGVVNAPGTSPLEVLAYDARESEMDALFAKWSGDTGAAASFSEARIQKWRGETAARTSNIGAGTTLLSGASQAGLTYYGATANRSGGGGLSTQAGRDYSPYWESEK